MKYLNKFFLFAALGVGLLMTSCSKNWLDVNSDPNRVTETNVTPDLIFPAAAVGVGGRQASGDFTFLDHWMGYYAPNGDFAPNLQEQTYALDFNFGDALWQRHYNVLFDLYQTKVKSLAPGGDSVLAAASMILSAKLFQELVDLYGDIPYSQAFQSTQTPNPAYDKAQDVYKSLLLSLDTAVDYMTNKTAAKSFAGIDVVFRGDQIEWTKFANTLRLRLLIRQSEVSGFDPSAVIAKIQATGGVLGAGQSANVNPGYVNDVDKQNPYYANFGYTPTGNKATTSDNANTYILGILSSTADPRIGRFFQPNNSNYVGGTYGAKQNEIPLGAQSSYFGPGLIGEDLDKGAGATQPQWIIPSFESLFLYAEAVARGWIGGDTAAAYESAVIESFRWLHVTNADSAAAKYLQQDDPRTNWELGAGSTASSKVKFIVYQKYIALTGIDPLESYSDQRRLHFLPDNGYISINPAKVSNTLPLRLLYPQSEYTTNSTNVMAVGTIDPFSTKIFWEP